MLGAFFDDSGTDEGSPICVIGGLLGTEDQWKAFAYKWAGCLANSVPGKPRLKQFHLIDCINHNGEFVGYNHAETDLIQRLFRDVIVRSDIVTIAVGVDKVAWNELVTCDLADELGEPIELCFVQCMERVIRNARFYRPGEPVSVFFDQGTKEKLQNWSYLYESQKAFYPELDVVRFAPVKVVFPLQAAVTIATASFHYNKEWLKNGVHAIPNPHFQDFMKRRYSEGFMIGREHIAEVVARVREKIASRV